MRYVLFDGFERAHLLPFTFTRPVAELRIGILTIREKWHHHLGVSTATMTEPYLAERYPPSESEENIYINASFLPVSALAQRIHALGMGQSLSYGGQLLAFRAHAHDFRSADSFEKIPCDDLDLRHVERNWHLITHNAWALSADFELLTRGRQSQLIDPTNQVWGERDRIFIEAGARVQGASLNANQGPIYIGKRAEVMEGASIRGPFALGADSRVKMGARIYGATTAGPFVTLGGEVKDAILFGYTNKAHEGYLGNAVLGTWCNLGAGTDNSNLKNTYGQVKLWNYALQDYQDSGLQFCGLFMGDHSRCGIHSMFNTGTVVGVSCNLFGAGFHDRFIPSFRWGGHAKVLYRLDKALEAAQHMMQRRGVSLTEADRRILQHLFETQS